MAHSDHGIGFIRGIQALNVLCFVTNHDKISVKMILPFNDKSREEDVSKFNTPRLLLSIV